MSAPTMSARETLAAVEAAYRADRPLTPEEDGMFRHWATQVGTTGLDGDLVESAKLHGALSSLADPIRNQNDVRRERARVAAEQEAARVNAAKLAERDRAWEALLEAQPLMARLYQLAAAEPGPLTAMRLLAYMDRTDRPPAPPTFMANVLPEYARRSGF